VVSRIWSIERPIYNDFELPLTQIVRSCHYSTLNTYLRNFRRCRHSYNRILWTYTHRRPTQISPRMTMSDFEWLVEVFKACRSESRIHWYRSQWVHTLWKLWINLTFVESVGRSLFLRIVACVRKVLVFTARCVCIARIMSQAACLSACLSVTRQYCVETVKHMLIFFKFVSHTILVFLYQTLWHYSDGNSAIRFTPLPGAPNTGGIGKKLRFSTNSLLYLGNDTR